MARNHNMSFKHGRGYILALSIIALLSLSTFAFISHEIEKQTADATVINLSGRQRMLSQNLTKNFVLLANSSVLPEGISSEDLLKDIKHFETVFNGLQFGDSALKLPGNNSKKINQMFAALSPHFVNLTLAFRTANANWVLNTDKPNSAAKADIRNPLPAEILEREAIIRQMLKEEQAFLSGMDQIVFQYESEARHRVRSLQYIELVILILTLLTLLFEGLFIFRPLALRINTYTGQLEQKNALLKVRESELKALNASIKNYVLERESVAASVVNALDEERSQMAEAMHDSLGHYVLSAGIIVESLLAKNLPLSPPDAERMAQLQPLLQDAYDEVRGLSQAMLPERWMTQTDLPYALNMLCDRARKNTNLRINLNLLCEFQDFTVELATGIYKMTQEGLTNIMKHAKAAEVTIQLMEHDDSYHFSIEDDGIGFDSSIGEKFMGLGLKNMTTRVKWLNGVIDISSAPGRGVSIVAIIPRQSAKPMSIA